MTPDHIAIGPVYDGPVSIDEQIAMFPRIVLSERVPTDKQVTLLSDTVAIGNFGMTLRGTLDGKPLHERAYSTEIWVKRDGKWLQKLYQETAIGEH